MHMVSQVPSPGIGSPLVTPHAAGKEGGGWSVERGVWGVGRGAWRDEDLLDPSSWLACEWGALLSGIFSVSGVSGVPEVSPSFPPSGNE